MKFRKNQKVSYVTAGKVARLEGMSGKVVTGIVTNPTVRDGFISVMADHRTKKDAMFKGMGSLVPVTSIVSK